VTFELVGDGLLRSRFEELAAAMHLGECLTVRGALDRAGVEAALKRASLLLSTSVFAQTWGIANLEGEPRKRREDKKSLLAS